MSVSTRIDPGSFFSRQPRLIHNSLCVSDDHPFMRAGTPRCRMAYSAGALGRGCQRKYAHHHRYHNCADEPNHVSTRYREREIVQ